MSEATAVLADGGIRLSDPKPAYCSACFKGARDGVDFIDFDAAYDSGTMAGDELQVIAGSDDLHLCTECLKRACEVVGLKPELHARQLQEIRDRDRLIEHQAETIEGLRHELNRQLDAILPTLKRGPKR